MTWTEFLWLYSLLAALLAAWLVGHGYPPLRLTRILGAVTALAFLVDQPSESRGFWYFHPPRDATVLDVPLANLVFAAATAIFVLVIRRQADAVLARRKIDP